MRVEMCKFSRIARTSLNVSVFGGYLRVTEANKVPISSHIQVTSTTFKQLNKPLKKIRKTS